MGRRCAWHSGLTSSLPIPGLQRTGHRWGDPASADGGAPPDHHGAEARTGSQDPGPGECQQGWRSPDKGGGSTRAPVAISPTWPMSLQVAKRLGRVFYMASFPVALPLQPPTLRAPEQELASREHRLSPAMSPSPYAGRVSPKQENGTMALLPGSADPPQPLC